ncbi:MAG: hypothetical protein ABSE73_18765 [Planctomycetota bacterium]
MKCKTCGAELPIRAVHCYQCGTKVTADFGALEGSVHEDAAQDRALKAASYMKWVLLALLFLIAVLYGINDLLDKPLTYDAATLPAVSAPSDTTADIPDLKKKYAEPRPEPPLPEATTTAFGYRLSPLKEKLRAAGRGDAAPDKLLKPPAEAIAAGLRYLVQRQDQDGCWPVAIDPLAWQQFWSLPGNEWGSVGVTSLCLMAFLGEGDNTWAPNDPAKRAPSPYADRIQKAVKFLLRAQDQESGRFLTYDPVKKAFLNADDPNAHFMYNQGLATLALCEAAGLSGDVYLRAAAQKAVKFILDAQTPKGGWNYFALPAGDNDTSLSAWQVQALWAAREIGLKVPQDKWDKALEMYKQATQLDKNQAFVRYNLEKEDPNDKARVSLCGIALMVRQMLGEEKNSHVLKQLVDEVLKAKWETKREWGPSWVPNKAQNSDAERGAQFDPYRLYFAAYGLYFFKPGKDWDDWNEKLKKSVLEMQASDGGWRASDAYSRVAGSNYSTAMCILILQVYYRLQ